MRLQAFLQGNSTVRQAFQLIAPEARTAIESEIVPQIEEMISDAEALQTLVAEANAQIVGAFKTKNETYTRLIRYKAIDQADDRFARDLVEAMSEWGRKTQDLLQEEVVQEQPFPVLDTEEQLEDQQDIELLSPFELTTIRM